MIKKLCFLVALCVPVAAAPAGADDCLFDGSCAQRPADEASAVVAGEPAGEPRAQGLSRWEGAKKGAEEGGVFGLYATLTPAVALVSEGFGRSFSRAADGARDDNGGGGLYYYGGLALAAVLYVPALVFGAVGAIVGAATGTVAPDAVKGWDAESFLF